MNKEITKEDVSLIELLHQQKSTQITRRGNIEIGDKSGNQCASKRVKLRLVELPEEILLKVFTFLDPILHLVKLCSVCSVWNRAIKDPEVWHCVEFKNKASNTNDKIITDLLDYCSAAKVLNLAGCTDLTRCTLELIPTKCFSLTELSISQIKIPCKSIVIAVVNLPHLVKVDLSFTKTNNDVLVTISKSCHKLEYINIRGCEVFALPKFGCNLAYFDASGSKLSPTSVLSLETEKLAVLLLWGIHGSAPAPKKAKRDVMFPLLRIFKLSAPSIGPSNAELQLILSQSNQLEEVEIDVPHASSDWIYNVQLDFLRIFKGRVVDDELNYIIDNSNVKILSMYGGEGEVNAAGSPAQFQVFLGVQLGTTHFQTFTSYLQLNTSTLLEA
eukprot:Phypoly_transcript_08541.p1 GENE.Phypoly_transcript_08541~~Phypoly_transcript_08541.p1  ORF type:complete len:450 (+),score=13.29 Phypoly_transcript_08541:193-1350(+)